MRVAKRGHASRTGANGEAGDLIVKLKIRPHPYFSKEGHNIVSDLNISLADAVLGGQTNVRTINGMQTVHIPPGTLPQDSITLSGLGFQYGDERSGKSAQILKVNLVYPQVKPSEKTRAMLKELASLESEINNYDPAVPKARECYHLREGEERATRKKSEGERKEGIFSSFKNWFGE